MFLSVIIVILAAEKKTTTLLVGGVKKKKEKRRGGAQLSCGRLTAVVVVGYKDPRVGIGFW